MKTVTISSETVTSKEELFSLIKYKLALPDYCGSNLDALHDCLGDIFEEFEINIAVDDALKESLGGTYKGLMAMLSELDHDNKYLNLNIIY